jgi:2-keto-4-pentenoate hydratase
MDTLEDIVRIRRAAEILWEHWQGRTKLDALPEAVRPRTRAEGYAVQREVQACSGQRLRGWKLAATSIPGQRHIGVTGPMAGRLLANRTYPPGAELSLAGNGMRVAEPEFALVFAHDLVPRATPYVTAEVLDAVAALHLALEVPDSRYRDFVHAGEGQLIADNACAHDLILGPAVDADWRRLDLVTHPVSAEVMGRYRRDGSGAAVLGDPRVALTWLVNELSGIGEMACAGQVVITGTCMASLEIQEGDVVQADFGALGALEARFGR